MSDRRLALRIARREAMRAKGRTTLVLIMIALPVLGVTAADVLYRTERVSSIEALDRNLGHAQALVTADDPAFADLRQAPDPRVGTSSGDTQLAHPASLTDIAGVLGPRTATVFTSGHVYVDTRHGRADVEATETDLRSPLAAGMFRLARGRWPSGPAEVVVNSFLAGRGPTLGHAVTVRSGDGTTSAATVVGIAESATYRSEPVIAGPPGALGLVAAGAPQQWLVGGAAVPWSQVKALNALGVQVLSRAVIEHPPVVPEFAPASTSKSRLEALALVVAMVLLEVVLLAGPSFAVGARRQQRSLALMAATGATPEQTRRVVLASAVVVGAAAAVAGVVGGIATARLLQPLLQRQSSTWFGPFQINARDLIALAGFGLVSALLAALVPAWLASRQDVVAVLAGRRGDRRPSRRSPVLGAVLLAAGIALAVAGARGYGELSIALAAIVCVLGMILLVPLVVAGVARLGRWLPLPLRFAVRDADRHRTRTVPAVAAVAATVAGVVALGIATSSNQLENRRTYQPVMAMGDGAVTPSYQGPLPDTGTNWDDLERRLTKAAPGADPQALRGIFESPEANTSFSFRVPGASDDDVLSPYATEGIVSAQVLVSDGPLPAVVATVRGIPATARGVLERGGALVFASHATGAQFDSADRIHRVEIRAERYDDQGNPTSTATTTVPAVVVDTGIDGVPVQAVVAPAVVTALGQKVSTVGLYLHQPQMTRAEETDAQEALAAAPTPGNLAIERGYQQSTSDRLTQIVLAALGAMLMLGGTLTATFLALSDARPDLATLSAVGATPRMRRSIAASYALTIGLVGSLLGAVVGFVPGLAIVVPLTSSGVSRVCQAGSCRELDGGSGPFFDVPWTLIGGLVVGLPLLVAALVWLVSRSRLPLVARLS